MVRVEPIHRARVVERIAAAAAQRVVLIVAPAGYGKTVAVRQFLEGLPLPCVRFDVHADNATLLGFVRGFAEAATNAAPDARETVSGAYERSRASTNAGADLAIWMDAHLKSFSGMIAIDDLHLAEGDPEVTKFLVSLIERTRDRIRWLIATRSSLDLPVGTWFAAGDIDVIINALDLTFSIEEARAAAAHFQARLDQREIDAIVSSTEGWATAINFALRTSTRFTDLQRASATSREMIYQYLAEQVYRRLSEAEKELLRVACLLPEIDVDVLTNYGFPNAAATIAKLRTTIPLTFIEQRNAYRCHELFREFFLRYEYELESKHDFDSIRVNIGQTLERRGDFARALSVYVEGHSRSIAVRLLEQYGFTLIEEAHSDSVVHALQAFNERTKQSAVILGLRGVLEANAGKVDRAERFLAAAVRLSSGRLKVELSIRLAVLRMNLRRNAVKCLEDVLALPLSDANLRAELLAALGAANAAAGLQDAALQKLEATNEMLLQVSEPVARAKVLQRIGFAGIELGQAQVASDALAEAYEIAIQNRLYSLAGRALSASGTVTRHYVGDLNQAIALQHRAFECALKAGDIITAENALLSQLEIALYRGDVAHVNETEEALKQFRVDCPIREALRLNPAAYRAAWRGDFIAAERLWKRVIGKDAFPQDTAYAYALHALFLAALGRIQEADEDINNTLTCLGSLDRRDTWTARIADQCRSMCIIAATTIGRHSLAARLLRVNDSRDEATSAIRQIASSFVACDRASGNFADVEDGLDSLIAAEGAGLAGVLRSVISAVRVNLGRHRPALTVAELTILQSLSDGYSPKEIARSTNRSVFTVRTHIRRIITKLECRGSREAVNAARYTA